MTLAVYDFSSKEITIASAAHLKPIHFREGKWVKNSVSKIQNGPLIGFGVEDENNRIKYQNFTISVNSGDYLFFYTDGVNEAAFDNVSEQYGKKRVLRFLKKELENEKVLDNLLDNIYEFQKKQQLDDDITMALFKIA